MMWEHFSGVVCMHSVDCKLGYTVHGGFNSLAHVCVGNIMQCCTFKCFAHKDVLLGIITICMLLSHSRPNTLIEHSIFIVNLPNVDVSTI